MAKVVIIGAGAAGLSAADELHRHGIEMLILEARDRIGGRIHTTHGNTDPAPLELGAEFIHGRPPATFDLVRSAQLPIAECSDQRLLRQDGRLAPMEGFWKIIEKIDSQIAPQSSATYQQFLETADGTAFEKEVAKSFVEGFNAARAEKISASSVALEDQASKEMEGDHQYRFVAGYKTLIHELTRRIPAGCIRTQHVVQVIRWRRDSVTVDVFTPTGVQSFSADRLVITVPIGVLRATPGESGAIRFNPPITEKQQAWQHIEPGHVLKFVAQFHRPFWRDLLPNGCREVGFALNLPAAFPTWWDSLTVAPNVLTGWAGGPPAEALVTQSRQEILRAALHSLAETFGVSEEDVAQQLQSWHYHNWSSDPFSRCAYSYPGVGGIEAARSLAEPVEGTLFFAGEATDFSGQNGTVHGALASGLRAARDILSRY